MYAIIQVMKKVFFLAFLFLLTANGAFAARIQIEPEQVRPLENVKLKVLFDSDEHSADTHWFVDDTLYESGVNSIEIKAPEFGKSKKVKLVLNYGDRVPEILSIDIKPYFFDIIYEAETYVPTFLGLAPLSSPGSSLKLQAFVKMPDYQSEKLLYLWKVNGKKMPYISGIGKDKVKISSDVFDKTQHISLEIYDPKKSILVAQKDIYVLLQKPELALYLKSGSLGWMFNSALSGILFLNGTERLLAIPFNANVKKIFSPKLDWIWTVDNRYIQNQESNSPYVEVSFTDPKRKRATLRLDMHNKNSVNQDASIKLILTQQADDIKRLPSSSAQGAEIDDGGFGI